ncbi:Auxin responsive protein [Musa troglodytarum]|uniref:Auxin responsive protein n=1 Tax=Musa troglodytarum TaxID=320322 RepID=A0A9E7ECD6_9LILI|nr:Auxin responsive protein [Musa troglodytarum]
MGKCSKIRHIVWLRQMLRRWRLRAAAVEAVPAGHVAVCVGNSSRRFVVRASHLNHPAFRELLRQAEEEFGFSRPGPLSLPCDEALFQDVLHLISSSSSRFTHNTLEHLTKLPHDIPSSSCCCDVDRWLHAADSIPLLHAHCIADKPVW